MVVTARKTVKFYDFWRDKDYEVTEDPSSAEESENETWMKEMMKVARNNGKQRYGSK